MHSWALVVLLLGGCARTPAPLTPPAAPVAVSDTSTALRDTVFQRTAAGSTPSGIVLESFSTDGRVVGLAAWMDGTVIEYASDGTGAVGYEGYPTVRDAAQTWLNTAANALPDLRASWDHPYPSPGTVSLYVFDQGALHGANVPMRALSDPSHPLNETLQAGLFLEVSMRAVDRDHPPVAMLRMMAPAMPAASGGPVAPTPSESAPGTEGRPGTMPPSDHHLALLDPSLATETAPDTFRVRFETTRGDFVVQVHREWAPRGADRFYNLVQIGFYDHTAFFRTIENFVTQWGISPYPSVSAAWKDARIKDDPVRSSNTRGRLTFAKSGRPHTRTTQLYISYRDAKQLDDLGFAPFAEVVEGMDVVDALHKTGEGKPVGAGPSQDLLQERGDAYLATQYPEIDRILRATVIE